MKGKKGKPFKIFKVTLFRNKILAAKARIILLSRLQIQFCFSGQKQWNTKYHFVKTILVHLTFLNSTTTSFLCLLIVWKESKPEVCYVLNLFQVIKILHNYFQEMHFEQYLYTRFHFHYRSSNQTGSWNNYSCLHYCTIKQSLLGLCWKKKGYWMGE